VTVHHEVPLLEMVDAESSRGNHRSKSGQQ
jgi:hypothetical protein